MHVPITPHGRANFSHPPQGPNCFCNEPTVLHVLNGRNVYVCYKYPNHHCRACCPADVMLLDSSPRSAPPAAPQPFGSPLPLSPMSQDAPLGSPHSPEDSSTPSNNNGMSSGGRTPRMPAAPSKRSTPSSATSRLFDSSAARSLTPIFNGCAAAASRAQQLGGRFARYRPQAQSIAKMQRQMSSGPSPSSQDRGTSAATNTTGTMGPPSASKKRVREEPSQPITIKPTANAPGRAAMSVQTVSRGPEVRKAWNGNRGGLPKPQQ